MPEVLQTWDGFQVSLSTGLANALAITKLIESSGLVGDVTFTLPDGGTLSSVLALDTNVAGPWEAGAVLVDISGATATLTNRAGRPMNLFDLALTSGSGPLRHQPLELALAPGASVQVPLEGGPADGAWVRDSQAESGCRSTS